MERDCTGIFLEKRTANKPPINWIFILAFVALLFYNVNNCSL